MVLRKDFLNPAKFENLGLLWKIEKIIQMKYYVKNESKLIN